MCNNLIIVQQLFQLFSHFAALLVTIGIIIWLTYVFSPFVASWSMGMAIIAGILALIAGLLLIPEVEDKDDYYDDDDYYRRNRKDDYSPETRRNNDKYQTTSFIGNRPNYDSSRSMTPPSRYRREISDDGLYDNRPVPATADDFRGTKNTTSRPFSPYSFDLSNYSPVPAPLITDTRRTRRARSVSPYVGEKPPKVRTPDIVTRPPTPEKIDTRKIYDSKPTPLVPEWSDKSPYSNDYKGTTNIDSLPDEYRPGTYNNVSQLKLQRDQA